MDDSLARTRPPSPGEFLRRIQENPTGLPKRQEPAADVPPSQSPGPETFDPNSTDYKAYGRSMNQSLPSLRFILKNKSERACCYAHLDSHHPDGCEFIPSLPGKGNVIKLRFAGSASAFMVTIEGRHLRPMWELILAHLTPWVHEYPADIDVEGKGVSVVTSIIFTAEK